MTERIVLDESVRMLAIQDGTLASLRARAGTLLAATSLVTAFLAPAALEARDPTTQAVVREFDALAWVATGSFAAVVIAALIVLWPYRWKFGHSSHKVMDELLDTNPPASEEAVLRHLSYYNDESHTANATKLQRLFVVFELGCLVLAAEIGFWLAALAD